jgi:hypothetical protein
MRVSNCVHFPSDPLTMISRQPTALEAAALEDFEHHARHCRDCQAARHLTSFISPDLCARGYGLAQDLTRLFYSASDGNVYSTTATTTRLFRIEISINFREVRRLYRVRQQPRTLRPGLRSRRLYTESRRSTNILPIRTSRRAATRTSQR